MADRYSTILLISGTLALASTASAQDQSQLLLIISPPIGEVKSNNNSAASLMSDGYRVASYNSNGSLLPDDYDPKQYCKDTNNGYAVGVERNAHSMWANCEYVYTGNGSPQVLSYKAGGVAINILCLWPAFPSYSAQGIEYPDICAEVIATNIPRRLKNRGAPQCGVGAGNPMNVATGNKFQKETDYVGRGLFPLTFERYYNSDGVISTEAALSLPWRHSYQRNIQFLSAKVAYAFRPDGRVESFTYTSGIWQAEPDNPHELIQKNDGTGNLQGFQLQTDDGTIIEDYDAAGRLLQIADRIGNWHRLSYADGQGGLLYASGTPFGYAPPSCAANTTTAAAGTLACVANNAGRSLQFETADQGHIRAMLLDDGSRFEYRYGEVSAVTRDGSVTDVLTSVVYPDQGERRYWYNEAARTEENFPLGLTGITDQNGDRYASWSYDGQRRAVTSEHGVDQEKVSVKFGQATAQVSQANGVKQQVTLTIGNGVALSTGNDQAAGAGCAAASMAKSYDARNNVLSNTDYRGVRTAYTYAADSNLETSRRIAVDTPEQVQISTEWDARLRMPTAIAAPKLVTRLQYTQTGLLLKRTEQQTADVNGLAGFSAAPLGTARSWTFEYNAAGQMMAAYGPRTTVASIQNEYDTQGNLTKSRNSLGHEKSYGSYSVHGDAQQVTDENGVTTTYIVDWRGRVRRSEASGRIYLYDYDKVDQLVGVREPGRPALRLSYDTAHRLIAVTDARGNSVRYALDSLGNRTSEEVRDPGGTLVRSVARVFDALNRVQQVTGGSQ